MMSGQSEEDDSPKTGVASAPRLSTSAPGPTIPHSSAAFLHHLHTDPTSHHITLSATTSRIGSSTPNKSPGSLTEPLEPTVVERNKPTDSPSRPSNAPASSSDSVAGPPSLRGVNRKLSRRGRPNTAPDTYIPSPLHEPVYSPDEPVYSPDLEDVSQFADHPSPQVQDLLHLTTGEDVCVSAMRTGIPSETAEAETMFMEAVGRGNLQSSLLLGGAGDFQPTQEQPDPNRRMSSPPDNLSWKTFSKSYAHGLFDPNRIPNPPMASHSPTGEEPPSAHSSPGRSRYVPSSVAQIRASTVASGSSQDTLSSASASGSSAATLSTHASSAPSTSRDSSIPARPVLQDPIASALPAKMKALELENLPQKPSNFMRPDKLSLPSYSLAAATVRMASSTLRESDFAPLGMPSPERELMDPMASVVSTESGQDSASSDPGNSRFTLSRSMSSAVVPTHSLSGLLPTIQASPVSTPNEGSHHVTGRTPLGETSKISPSRLKSPPGGIVTNRIPSATAPLGKTLEVDTATDYFGSMSSPHYGRQTSFASQSSSSKTETEKGTPRVSKAATPDPSSSRLPTPPLEIDEDVVLPPLATSHEIGPLFEKIGWLPAPVPPHELERRKALYRFGILHTAKNINFDRIAHMAKLVFNTKMVLISFTDVDNQWHKSEIGLGANEASRISSFCSHTILVRTAEPLVILDATLDWRFVNNPQVIGPPHIRFYAGAPLRTAEGYNLGSLCIIDDKPRIDFPPRSRLILKEFAAVVMREMQLWRDKLQLRVRDRIQNSMERFTRECLEMDARSASNADPAARMDQVYSRAAQLVSSTLDMDGCFILDISQFEMTEIETATGVETVFRADPYGNETESPVLERRDGFGPVNPFPVLATSSSTIPTRPLTSADHEKLSGFLRDSRDGKIFENVAPSWIRYSFPSNLRYGMVVPVYGVNQQPFAMICAYTNNKIKQFLEGYELQFLRAIGVIILSAVLRRRMVLADKTKSVLISSVSHELRTPLHGILAAAELLSDTKLDANQISFLKTVQTCGNSLIETVNHVLDFTKLSGSTQSSSGSGINRARVNLASLVESTVESCWIGQRARFFHGDSEIGSFYAPPAPSGLIPRSQRDSVGQKLAHVETVIDIAQREKGWNVRCERGGLRRVLMNLVGNSLKFTTDGYVQITLREMPHPPGGRKIPVEMAVIDTGKGIGKEFLKEQLFHPFSQENPLQTGTGLGLAIVNSIVRSEDVDGKVDVWSSEGVGTEIRVSFEVDVIDEDDESGSSASSSVSLSSSPGRGHSVSLLGFASEHRGHMLSLDVLSTYAVGWGFELKENAAGDVLVINDDDEMLDSLQDLPKAIVLLTTSRSNKAPLIRDKVNRLGGFVQLLYKPAGPSNLKAVLARAVDYLEQGEGSGSQDASTPSAIDDLERPSMSRGSSGASAESNSTVSELSHKKFGRQDSRAPLTRRRSEENEAQPALSRPSMAPRGITYHHGIAKRGPSGSHVVGLLSDEHNTPPGAASNSSGSPSLGSPTSTISTISLADGGVMLKSAAIPVEAVKREKGPPRVLVVEDNVINRRVLGAYLKKRGMEYAEAVDGSAGVDIYRNSPPNYWDVILMDISMPVMNGHEATRAIRRLEAGRRNSVELAPLPTPGSPVVMPPPKVVQARVKIFALTGLATADDKREAFSSGVDGYLVKPVSLKSLGVIFQKIGFSVDTPSA